MTIPEKVIFLEREVQNVDSFILNFIDRYNSMINEDIKEYEDEFDNWYKERHQKEWCKKRRARLLQLTDGNVDCYEYSGIMLYLYFKYNIAFPPEDSFPHLFIEKLMDPFFEEKPDYEFLCTLQESIIEDDDAFGVFEEYIKNNGKEGFFKLLNVDMHYNNYDMADLLSLLNAGINIDPSEFSYFYNEYGDYDFCRLKDDTLILKDYLIKDDLRLYLECQYEEDFKPASQRRHRYFCKHLAAVNNIDIIINSLGIRNKIQEVFTSNKERLIVINNIKDYPFGSLY